MIIKNITGDMGNAGLQLNNLKESLEKINNELDDLRKSDELTNFTFQIL